jgi:two-component system response regulator YesN
MTFDSPLAKIKHDQGLVRELRDFAKRTDLPLRFVSIGGEEIWRGGTLPSKSFFCRPPQSLNGSDRNCHRIHRKAARESIRWGEAIIGKCCHSFMQITAPVIDRGRLMGILVASPFLLFEPSELQAEEISDLQEVLRNENRVVSALAKIPVVREDETRTVARTLFNLADRLSTPNLGYLAKIRQIQELQGKIVEQINDLKASDKDFNAGSLVKLSYEQEKEIITRIRLGDREGAKEILYRLLAILLSQYLENFDLLKISALELVIILARAAVEAGTKIEEALGIKYRFITESANIRDQEHLCIWIVQLLDKLMDGIYQTRNVKNYQRLKDTLDFIEIHCQKPLSVEQIAREVCLSPSRLSHIIKDEMGVTLGDCISKTRIDKAKALLRETNLSIAQIAAEVGFPDQSYFTKVFKKWEKSIPILFRKSFPRPILGKQSDRGSPNGPSFSPGIRTS